MTLDGKPLDEGRIAFDGQDGKPPEFGDIKNGSFELDVRPGTKRVGITATRMVKPNVPGMPTMTDPVPMNYLPERYNAKTTLTAEVTSTSKEFPFDLTSK